MARHRCPVPPSATVRPSSWVAKLTFSRLLHLPYYLFFLLRRLDRWLFAVNSCILYCPPFPVFRGFHNLLTHILFHNRFPLSLPLLLSLSFSLSLCTLLTPIRFNFSKLYIIHIITRHFFPTLFFFFLSCQRTLIASYPGNTIIQYTVRVNERPPFFRE